MNENWEDEQSKLSKWHHMLHALDYNEQLHIDNLDGAVTLFKSTSEGTETIAVFDEEHREVVEDLVKKVNLFYELFELCKNRQTSEYRVMLSDEYFNGMDVDSDDFEKWMSFLKDTDEDDGS